MSGYSLAELTHRIKSLNADVAELETRNAKLVAVLEAMRVRVDNDWPTYQELVKMIDEALARKHHNNAPPND